MRIFVEIYENYQKPVIEFWKILQNTIENVCQLRLSENFAKNFTGNCNYR